MWHLTAATPADRDLIVDTLRAEADRREKAAKESSFRLVTGSPEGRISLKQQRMVQELGDAAKTLRALAYELAEQTALPVVEPLSLAEVVEEERAATYPPLTAVEAPRGDPQPVDVVTRAPSGRARKPRQVKVVNFPDDPDDDLNEAIRSHPANGPQEDQP